MILTILFGAFEDFLIENDRVVRNLESLTPPSTLLHLEILSPLVQPSRLPIPPPNASIPEPQLAITEANCSSVVWEQLARR